MRGDLQDSAACVLSSTCIIGKNYMAYNGDSFRHYIRNYWYEVGTEFDNCGTKLVENSTKYNLEVIKYRP